MKQLIPAPFAIGVVMALVGTIAFITGWVYVPYICAVGAGSVALAQVSIPLRVKSKTLRQLCIQQIFDTLALILIGILMFTTRGSEWITYLAIAAILELYTAFRIPQGEEKELSK